MLRQNLTLAPIFDDREKLKKDIRAKLLKVGMDFYKDLNLGIDLEDVILTGSMAGYNFTKFSDIDLHVVVPLDEIDATKQVLDTLRKKAKYSWNKKHDITVDAGDATYDVELYLQDKNEPHTSSAIYSILNNKWIKKPIQKTKASAADKNTIKTKARALLRQINLLYRRHEKGKDVSDAANKIKKHISDMRKAGLDSPAGEKSIENYVFKVIRNMEGLDRLEKILNQSYDRAHSVKRLDEKGLISPALYFDKKTRKPMKEIDRKYMPQSGEKTTKEIIADLEANGAELTYTQVPLKDLKFVQDNYNKEKVLDMVWAIENGNWIPEPVWVDNENHILDGNHRVLAYKEYYGNNAQVRVVKINLPLTDALLAYKKVTVENAR